MPVEKQTCFVIMPFGEKADSTGKNAKIIDFDAVYRDVIRRAVEDLGIKCVRCDEIAEAGWIHSKMFQHIYDADIAVVDITSLNPNVFYELGVRHALADCVTVLLRGKNTKIPFNIQGFQVIEYNNDDAAGATTARKKIRKFIENGLAQKKTDSPVHEVLKLQIAGGSPEIRKTEVYRYKVKGSRNKQICLVTGDLQNVKKGIEGLEEGIDIWVNSENTDMQMGRHFDRSVSSVIRYGGARKGSGGQVVVDTIADELAARTAGSRVPLGAIVVTGSGELEKKHGVKKIFHAAVVVGQVGKGYSPIPDVGECVRNALQTADDLSNLRLKSILFPLLGTGTARGNLRENANSLIDEAVNHLQSHGQCPIQRIYFLNWSQTDLETCRHILDHSSEVTPVKTAARTAHARKSAAH